MKEKGLTLIELLAVIVALSIVALIATPLAFNVIDESKKTVFREGINNIVRASKIYSAKIELNGTLEDCRYFSLSEDVTEITAKNGKVYYPLSHLNIKGDIPSEGEIKVCGEGINIDVSNGDYTGRYDGENLDISKGDLASNDPSIPIITSFITRPSLDNIAVRVEAYSPSIGGVIANYYYKINDGDYIKTTENNYTFSNLTLDTEYKITVKVENKSGVVKEESKLVRTKAFGEILIDVEKATQWTNSKKVTLSGTTEEYPIEYKIIKHNEQTLAVEESEFKEYTESFTLDTLATPEYPTTIIVRYNSNGIYSEYKSYMTTKIDTISPSIPTSAVRYENQAGQTRANDDLWSNKILWWGDYAATDDGGSGVAKYEYSTGCTGDVSGKLEKSYTYKNGTNYTFCIRTVDNAGNTSEWSNPYYFKVDTEAPTCTVSKTNTGSTTGVTTTVTCSDKGGSGVLECSKGNTGLKESTTYTVTDEAGNSGMCEATVTATIQYRKRICSTYNANGSICGYYCPYGYTQSGSSCYKTTTSTTSASYSSCLTGSNTCKGGYYCPSGYSLSGSTCYQTTTTNASYSSCLTGSNTCKAGYYCTQGTLQSDNTKCALFASYTTTCLKFQKYYNGMCYSKTYSSGSSCAASCKSNCYVQSSNVYICTADGQSPKKSCPSGYTLNSKGTTCYKYVSSTYSSCLTGSNTCQGGYYCPSGYSLSGTTCNKTTGVSATYSYCLTGSNTCQGGYYCPSGYSLSGTTCSKSTTSTTSMSSNRCEAAGCSTWGSYSSWSKDESNYCTSSNSCQGETQIIYS